MWLGRRPTCKWHLNLISKKLETMRRERLSSIAVVDATQRPVGIFTQTDLLSRVVLTRLGVGRTVATLPLATSLGSLFALLVPVFPMVGAVRALELVPGQRVLQIGLGSGYVSAAIVSLAPTKNFTSSPCASGFRISFSALNLASRRRVAWY